MRKQVVILTGAHGTIGLRLSKKFVDMGYAVIGIDSDINKVVALQKGVSKILVAKHDQHTYDFMSNSNFDQSYFSLTHNIHRQKPEYIYYSVEEICKQYGLGDVRLVVHAASPASPIYYKHVPDYTIQSNVDGTRNMLRVADHFEARFVFTSTSEVYGTLKKEVFSEDDVGMVNSWGPRSMYDVAKMMGETLVKYRKEDISAGLVRIFNTYSPEGAPYDGRVINSFVYNLMNDRPVNIFGSGNQTRSFMFIDDLVDGIFRYATSTLEEPINLGNPNEYYSINELFVKIYQMIFPQDQIDRVDFYRKHVDVDKDDPPVRRPDISRAKEFLRWEPKIKLEDGLGQVIQAYEKYYIDNR